MRKITRKIVSMVMVAAMLLSITGCSSSEDSDKSSESGTSNPNGLETTSIDMGAARDTQLAPVIMCAIEKGFFEKYGLDVDLTLFPSGGDLVTSIATGDIDLGSAGDTPVTTLLTSDSGKFEFIARTTNLGGAMAIVANDDIQTAEDLEGKTIGYSSGNTSEALWLAVTSLTGIDTSDITMVSMGAADMLSAFEGGDIDAFCIWEPTVTNGVNAGGHRLVTGSKSYFNGTEEDFDALNSYALLAGSVDWIEANPKTVVAVLSAMNEACDWLNNNLEDGATIVSEWLELDYDDCLSMMERNDYGLSVDDQTIKDLTNSAEFLLSGDKISFVPDFNAMFDGSYLKQVDESLVSVTE